MLRTGWSYIRVVCYTRECQKAGREYDKFKSWWWSLDSEFEKDLGIRGDERIWGCGIRG